MQEVREEEQSIPETNRAEDEDTDINDDKNKDSKGIVRERETEEVEEPGSPTKKMRLELIRRKRIMFVTNQPAW